MENASNTGAGTVRRVRRQPDDYVPPFPMYTSTRAGDDIYATALIGVQAATGGDAAEWLRGLHGMLDADLAGKPLHVEQSWYIDPQGYRNDVLNPYWRDDAALKQFFDREDVRSWRSQPRHGLLGWWRESMYGPMSSVDSTYTLEDSTHGITRYAPLELMQFHGYMGSMRDRVPDYFSGKADGEPGRLARLPGQRNTQGRHLVVEDLPHNLCYIRGPLGALKASAEERQSWVEDIVPVLDDAADYLRDFPLESNCISLRIGDTVRTDFDSGVEGEIFGWFLTLQDLERFTEFHPKHLAILQRIGQYAARFNFNMRQNGGHEVLVVARGQVECEYVNCHPETGFLPYFPARDVSALQHV